MNRAPEDACIDYYAGCTAIGAFLAETIGQEEPRMMASLLV